MRPKTRNGIREFRKAQGVSLSFPEKSERDPVISAPKECQDENRQHEEFGEGRRRASLK